jgi:hypothetical protein
MNHSASVCRALTRFAHRFIRWMAGQFTDLAGRRKMALRLEELFAA